MHVPADLPRRRHAVELIGRRAECAVLDQLIGAVRAGGSRALLMHGEPGAGKTALLDYVAVQALGCRILPASGVQSEMELPFAGLHQLCASLLDRLDHLPGPQHAALGTAFGISAGPMPDRFLVGLAVLNLFSHIAQEQPLICLVDDHQWLDSTSAQVLAFVARRLGTESVGLVMATRALGPELSGLPALMVGGLRATEAGALLDTALTGPLDTRVRDQLIAETRGNPLALLELPRGFTHAELAGGFGLPEAAPLSGSIEESFGRRIAALAEPVRQLLLIAASDPSGDSALVWRAAARLGVPGDAAAPAAEAGLLELGVRVKFSHPLARSAVYRSASPGERRQVHRALAEATEPALDPDRRAWHRAQAASGPDEEVAIELERSADRARARGGLAAAAAFLLRAATMTGDAARRANRVLAAAEAQLRAGSFEATLNLLAMAEAGPLDERRQARADLIRAQLAFVADRGREAPPLLLRAAQRLAPIDARLSRATYLDALCAAIFAGRLAGPADRVSEVARAVASAPPPPDGSRAPDLLLDGTAALYNRGYAAGLPVLRRAVADFGAGMSPEDELHWLSLACITAMTVCDDGRWDALSARNVELARAAGALGGLPLALTSRALFLVFSGDLTGARALTDEARAMEDATGTHLAPSGALALAAYRGDESSASDMVRAAVEDATRRGEGIGITMAEWAHAVLCNGLGRHRDAIAAARHSIGDEVDGGSLILPCAELVEAAVRSDQVRDAAHAYARIEEVTSACRTDWAWGLQARAVALLSAGDVAEDRYRAAIDHFGRTRLRIDLARAHLLYGEWLRREGRHNDAREQLRTAHAMFETMGTAGFADRAGRELRAVGGSVRRRVRASRHDELTAQEVQIARMARDGLSNPEIAGRLFLSPHTVQYHLRKVFTKLGVSSRSQLAHVLPVADEA